MANMHLVTGFAGYEHITSADQGLFNSYIFGDLEVVMERGNQFAASIISNNIIRVKDGDLLMQGRFARLNDDSYVDLTIDNGTQGYFRNDLIVARYQKDIVTAVETIDLVVIKGENFESNPVDPDHVKGDIKFGKDFQNDIPLWRISLNGLNVTGLTCLFSTFGMTMSNHAAQHSADGSDPITLSSIGAASNSALMSHVENTGNPHQVKATQIPVSEAVLAAYKQEGKWTVDDLLARTGYMLSGGQTIYQWRKEKTTLVSAYPVNGSFTYSANGNVYHSAEVEIGTDGKISLVNPTSNGAMSSGSSRVIPAGRYFYLSSYSGLSYVYRAVNEVTPTSSIVNNANVLTYNNVERCLAGLVGEVVSSTDQNAHYDGEVDADGYTYTALPPITEGIPQTQVVTFYGNGAAGPNCPSSLTFRFVPKLVFFFMEKILVNKNTGAVTYTMFLPVPAVYRWGDPGFAVANNYPYGTTTASSVGFVPNYASVDGTTMTWYNGGGGAEAQLNATDTASGSTSIFKYRYTAVAIG